jgi:hypothetical protein
MFAVMKDTEYASKETFTNNFFNDWRRILGKNHVVRKFQLCDFTPIYEWHLQEKEKKKQMTSEVDSYGFLCKNSACIAYSIVVISQTYYGRFFSVS